MKLTKRGEAVLMIFLLTVLTGAILLDGYWNGTTPP
jgi:hypothetical protein